MFVGNSARQFRGKKDAKETALHEAIELFNIALLHDFHAKRSPRCSRMLFETELAASRTDIKSTHLVGLITGFVSLNRLCPADAHYSSYT